MSCHACSIQVPGKFCVSHTCLDCGGYSADAEPHRCKFKATKVTIVWTEAGPFDGVSIEAGEGRESVWAKADAMLFTMWLKAEPTRGYFKTAFSVTFEDGDVYTGRLDVNATHKSLTNHINDYLKAISGKDYPWITPEHREQAAQFLNTYQIGDWS